MSESLARSQTKVVIGETEHPLAELTPIDTDLAGPLQPVSLEPTVVNALGSLVQLLPTAVSAGLQAASPAYLLRFAPDVAAQLSAGTATLMQSLSGGVRAIAVDASGKIVGQGELVSASGLSSMATAALVWQTLSIVTAQHYLHDMQGQLRSINQELRNLQSWVLYKEHAIPLGHERYIRQILALVERGSARELDVAAISNQLEQMGRECDQVLEMMCLIMDQQTRQLRHAPIAGVFSWDVTTNVEAAAVFGDNFDHAARTFIAAVRVKVLLAAFRSYFFHQVLGTKARISDASVDSQRGRTLMVAFYNLAASRTDDIWARTDVTRSLHSYSASVQDKMRKRRRDLRKGFDQLDEQLALAQARADALLQRREEPVAVVIRRDAQGNLLTYAAAPQDVALRPNLVPISRS